MCKITGPASTQTMNIGSLKDDKTYKAGDDGALVRTKSGSVKQWFREAFSPNSVKLKNQAALDALKKQLTEQYGDGVADMKLELTGKLATGKKTITGEDLKAYAGAFDRAQTVGAMARINEGIKELTKKLNHGGEVKAGDIMGLFDKSLPQGMPVPGKMLVLEMVMSKMLEHGDQEPLLETLKNSILGQDGADAVKLLDSNAIKAQLETAKEDLLNTESAAQREQRETANEAKKIERAEASRVKIAKIKDTIASLTKCQSALENMKAVQETLRQVLATAANDPRLSPEFKKMPEPGPSTASWLNPTPHSLKLLASLGVENLKDRCLNLLEVELPQQQSQEFLRGNEPGVALFRNICRDEMEPHFQAFQETLRSLVNEYAPTINTPGARITDLVQGLREPEKQALQNAIKEALNAPGLKKSLENCISAFTEIVRPTLVEKGDNNITAEMIKAFIGLAILGGLNAPLTQLRADPNAKTADKNMATFISVFTQTTLKDANLAPGTDMGNFFSKNLAGWKEMTAPLPTN